MAGFDARFRFTSSDLTPASVAAQTTAEQAFTGIPDVDAGDFVVATIKPTVDAGIAVAGARVSAAGEITLTFINATGGALTPTAAETYRFLVAKRQP